MATTRITFGAVLNTVSSAASTVTTVLDTATASVNMLSKFVEDAAEQQRIRSIIDMDAFAETAIEEAAIAEATRKSEIITFRKKSEQHDELFLTAYNRMQALLTPKAK